MVVGILSIYLANQPGLYRELLISLFPPVHRDLVRNVMVDISQTLRAWILGQLTSMFLLGGLAAIGFSILHVPYALTFGLFTGLIAIVPIFGTLISTILPAAFVLGEGGAGQALAVIGWGVIVHLLESNVISPLDHGAPGSTRAGAHDHGDSDHGQAARRRRAARGGARARACST